MCNSFLIKDWREQRCFRPRYDVRGAFQGDLTTTLKKITVKILSCMFAGTQYLSRPDETRTPFSALSLVLTSKPRHDHWWQIAICLDPNQSDACRVGAELKRVQSLASSVPLNAKAQHEVVLGLFLSSSALGRSRYPVPKFPVVV